MHCGVLGCAPTAEKRTRQVVPLTSAAAWGSGIRTPLTSLRAILTGTVLPAFHFERGAGEKNPRSGSGPGQVAGGGEREWAGCHTAGGAARVRLGAWGDVVGRGGGAERPPRRN